MKLLKRNPNKTEMFVIIVAVFCGCLITANNIAGKILCFGDIYLAGSIIIYPIVFILGEILTEIYGFKLARKTIVLALIVNLIAVIAFQIIIILPGAHADMSNGFTIVFEITPRILFACLCSYFAGSYVNAYVMHILKEKFSRHLFFRCVVSTFFGELTDTIIFTAISFIGVEPIHILITMIVWQVFFKVLYEIVAYPVTGHVIKWLNKLEDGPLDYSQKLS